MKTLCKIFSVFFLLLIIISCEKKQEKITNPNDYEAYLHVDKEVDMEELNFWSNKLKSTPNQFPYLVKIASAQTQLFNETGDINYLSDASSNLEKANQQTKYNNAGYLRSLARNYISQHRFLEALELLKKAEENGQNLKSTEKMLFDVYLELGNNNKAFHYLSQFRNTQEFDYLIRNSKWNDHEGKLDQAIFYMESATSVAEDSKNKNLMEWSYTNLADFYGHAGRIKDSYNYFLKALAINPSSAYAKKGISWIVFSHEKNSKESSRIIDAITTTYNTPDLLLLKADIAEYENNIKVKEESIAKYLAQIINPKYGDMYNKYNAILYNEDKKTITKAIDIAQREIKNRPTPQSYDLLAWSYFKSGKNSEALHIVENNIINKTFEPEVLFHAAEIYKANGKIEKAQNLKKELIESLFELGPLMETNIRNI